jgi:3-hydroxyacyl-[acyl-carrier-protein] dehydratase
MPDGQQQVAHRNGTRVLGFTELKHWLRHRHPMIYLDRVTDYEPGVFLESVLSVSGALDCVSGHFPERAIYPASNLMQAFAQSGIILLQLSTTRLLDDEITLIGSMRSRFTSIVVPGDRVIYRVRADRFAGNVFFCSATASVDDRPVATFKATIVRLHVDELGPQLW